MANPDETALILLTGLDDSRRALLELDLVFQRFWEGTGDEIDEETEAALARLLEMEDHDLWDLVSGRRDTADPQLNGMVERLRRI